MLGAAEHAAVEGEKKLAAAVEENNLAVVEDKKLTGEEDGKPEGHAGGINNFFAKEQVIDETVLAGTKKPSSDGGSAMINKEQTHLLDVPEEDDASKKLQLEEKKGEERKKTGLVEIKKEQQLGYAEKTEVPANTEKPTSEGGGAMINNEQNHLLVVPEEEDASKKMHLKEKKGEKRKRSKLVEIKKEQQMGDADKAQLSADIVDYPLRWRASYSTVLRKRHKRVCKGSILLDAKENRVILHDSDEVSIDSRYLKEGQLIYPGLLLELPCYMVQIREPILHSKEDPPLNRKRLKKRPAEKIMSSPQAQLMRSSIGMFARVAALRKEMSPQAQRRKADSPSVPNVTAHFPSPDLRRAEANFTRWRPRKLRSGIWKDFVPIYEHGKIAEGQCKHCNEVFPASKASGTNHIHRHLKKCLTRSSMHEMVAKMRASTSSPQFSSLNNWNFSQKESRRALSNLIVQHGLPFSIVEYRAFIKFVKSLNPMFKMVSRTTIKEDCLDSYKEERALLRERLKNCGARVSLTADMWTSNQRLGYLCITCHFIDKTWKMQKRILRFCMMETPHNGFRMYNAMLKSLQYWNIEDKVCSITLDNASVNGKMMEHLKENLVKKHMLTCGGELFHIRCGARVLNLIVQDGLFVMKGSIDNIRESIKYVKSSQAREELFADIVTQLGIICEKEPSLDVATRWNSTYLMLDSALPYREAFDELVEQDRQYKYAPSAVDWTMAEAVRSLLKIFFEATKVVSGSSYPTANRYFHEMWSVKLLLDNQAKNKNKVIASMVSEMQKKFDKYWKESYLANCIPVVFDPRYKFEFVKFRIKKAFGRDAEQHLEKVDKTIKSLFKDYSNEMGDSFVDPSQEVDVDEVAQIDNPLADWEAHLRVQKKQATNELDRYLSDDLFPQQKDSDILRWWELHSPKYPILSCIARDVLAIQASTVASESSFSVGGRTISDQRNRLKSKTVEALICLQDWLNADDPKPTNKDVEEEEEEHLVFYQGSECHEETDVPRNQSTTSGSSPNCRGNFCSFDRCIGKVGMKMAAVS